MSNKPVGFAKNFFANIQLTPDGIEALDYLFECAPPRELREDLIEIYHTYLIYVHGTLPLNFEKMSMNMYQLIQCLRILEEEGMKQNQSPLGNSSALKNSSRDTPR